MRDLIRKLKVWRSIFGVERYIEHTLLRWSVRMDLYHHADYKQNVPFAFGNRNL